MGARCPLHFSYWSKSIDQSINQSIIQSINSYSLPALVQKDEQLPEDEDSKAILVSSVNPLHTSYSVKSLHPIQYTWIKRIQVNPLHTSYSVKSLHPIEYTWIKRIQVNPLHSSYSVKSLHPIQYTWIKRIQVNPLHT